MSKKINPFAIGCFILTAFVILVITLIVLFHGNFFTKTTSFVLYFNNSVNGLDIGSSVKFKGVRIGNVKSIDVIYDTEMDIVSTPVIIEVNMSVFSPPERLFPKSERNTFYGHQIMNGLAAKLGMESFVTGKLFVELDYYQMNRMRFYGKNGTNLPQIPTLSSEIDKFISGADNILKKVGEFDFKSISDRLVSMLSKIDDQIQDSNISKLISDFSNTAIGIQNFLNSNHIINLLENASTAVTDFCGFVKKLSGTITRLEGDFAITTKHFRDLLKHLSETSGKFGETCDYVSSLIKPYSDFRESIKIFLLQGTKTLQSLRNLLDLLNKTPNAIFAGVDYEKKN